MAGIPPDYSMYWPCPNPNCNFLVHETQLTCPNCHSVHPALLEGSQQWQMRFPEPQRYLWQQLNSYGIQHPYTHRQCHTGQEQYINSSRWRDSTEGENANGQHSIPNSSVTVTNPPATCKTNTNSKQSYHLQCYFCLNPQDFTKSSDKLCERCNQRQPKNEPCGPLCNQGCGAKLLSPGARICERCGRHQRPQPRSSPFPVAHPSGSHLPGNIVQAPVSTGHRNGNTPSDPSSGDKDCLKRPIQETRHTSTSSPCGINDTQAKVTTPSSSMGTSITTCTTTTVTSSTTNGKPSKSLAKGQEMVPRRKPQEAKDLLAAQAQNTTSNKGNKASNEALVSLAGIDASGQNSVKLTFHVLIPKTLWGWDSKSTVHIRFGHNTLGNWTDCGNFRETRDFHDGTVEMTCTFDTFDKRLLNLNHQVVPYKYVVYSPKAKNDSDRYEYLHAHATQSTQYDRCLVIPAKERTSVKGEYHKYDLIAYPQRISVSKSVLENMKQRAFGFFSMVSGGLFGNRNEKSEQQETPEDFQPLNRQEMCAIGLECYLQNFKKMLQCGSLKDGLDIPSVATELSFISKSLCVEHIIPISTKQNGQVLAKDIGNKGLQHNLQCWFESIITHLLENREIVPMKRLLSAVCIVCCIKSVGVLSALDPARFLQPLTGMLSLHPENVETEFKHICSYIPDERRMQVAAAVSELCSQVARKTVKSFAIEWFFAIPLCHFLAKKSVPGGRPKLDFELDWQFYCKRLELTLLRKKAQDEKEFVEKYHECMKEYFSIDPLLLKLFAYLAPKREFCVLCERIPVYLSLEILIRRAASQHFKPEDETWCVDIKQVTLVCSDSQEHYSTPEYLSATVTSSIRLCSVLSKKLRSSEESHVTLLHTAFLCALCAIEKARSLYADEQGKTERGKAFESLQKTLNDWITNVMGSVFGRSYHTRAGWKGKEELKVWRCLLSVESKSLDGYQSVQDWHGIIEEMVNHRINALTSDNLKIDLVIEMEQLGSVHQVLEGIIMDAALNAVDSLLTKDQKHAKIDVANLAKKESEPVGRLLERIFEKQYPKLTCEPTLVELFEWDHWPRFISICENRPKLRQGLSLTCVKACSSAKSTVLSLCERYKSGEVSVDELKTSGRNINQICRLFEASSGIDKNNDLMSLKELQSAVEERKEELTCFSQRQTVLKYLCRYTSDVEGTTELQENLSRDYTEENMSKLCRRHPESNEVQVVCFGSAGTLDIFADKFCVLSTKHGSDLFHAAWKNALVTALKINTDLKLNDLYQMVWKPCIECCKQLLKSLSDLSIRVSDIDQVFKDHRDNLDTQLLLLCKGITETTEEMFEWSLIERAIKKIMQYWELCRFHLGAKIFLEIRDSLGLDTGDFSLVEKLSKELAMSGVSQSLRDIDDTLVDAGEFLEDIAKNQRKVDCLQSFARCQDIVKWLKEVTKGVKEIHNFVTVALVTEAGGEGDLSHDKLSSLSKVGSGFASLIYDFPKTAGFTELKEACENVWEALDKNKNLPDLLETCNRDIGWYQSVKETRGSIESTSYGQMKNILKYGCFEIGTRVHSKTVHSIHDFIYLQLTTKDEKVHKKSYNLDDLRDLESKLVLITGSKAENRTEVDHYLNILQYVARIADVLLALHQAGNVAYSGWEMTIKCAKYCFELDLKQEPQLQEEQAKQLVTDLSACAKEMENALKEWEKEVKEARNCFYELNYYTTRQLLQLRKNLGLARHSSCKHSEIDPEIMALLQSISQEVNSESVHSIVSELNKGNPDPQLAPTVLHDDDDEPETTKETHFADKCDTEETCVFATTETFRLSSMDDLAHNSTVAPNSSDDAKPKLVEQDLNDTQKATFMDLVKSQGYSRNLVLKAFENCKETDNQYDILHWCAEHEAFEEEEEEEVASMENYSSSDSESSEEENEGTCIEQQPSERTPFKLASGTRHFHAKRRSQLHVKVVHKQIINESHPIVQKLVENDYDLEDSIDAVRRCGAKGTLQEAMDYLDSKDIGNESPTTEFSSSLMLNEVPAEETLNDSEDIVIYDDTEIEEKYLSLDNLGTILQRLAVELPEQLQEKRTFVEGLKAGFPNLIVAQPRCVLRTALTLYMEDEALPLPTFEEVLICDSTTTEEEINLLWQRAIGDPGFKRIFCLVHAERLSYQTCDKVIETLNELSQGKKDYRLVIVCSREAEDKSHIVSKLLLHKRSIILKDNQKCQYYLRIHFISDENPKAASQSASIVDSEGSCVRVVSSVRAGMGKSLFIQRMGEKLHGEMCERPENDIHTVIPVHGPIVNSEVILNFLKGHYKDPKCKIYHFDIAPSISHKVDTILFSVLILRGLIDSHGHVWRCHPAEMYIVEATVQAEKDEEGTTLQETQSRDLLNLLPTVQCLSPTITMETTNLSQSQLGMDDMVFRGTTFQRVYQYLRRHAENADLDNFTFQGRTEGTTTDCLNLFIQNCGVQDPSWSELHHFVKFLDIQLESCEKSVFFMEEFIRDTGMSGIKEFVVKFMITMSRDFATPSLCGEVTRDSSTEQLVQYEIDSRRRWEESSHPYIFFNNDNITVTFVGFHITPKGNLLVPGHATRHIMTPQLYQGIHHQKVDFTDDYQKWSKQTMISKLSMVMGIEAPTDPDETYVLTIDNLIKILAIQIRFRCGIPVVIMGETGCGKTRLIRYMCDLARNERTGKNMLIKKVHGGIKESDIIKFVEKAEMEAKKNRDNKMDIVVFFDEANTTDAIGLIKEIMCDRRINGRPLSKDLKFIAACNPYRRHSHDMIERLEKAGLGFYVRATETQQRLGNIPLRQLVYRVLDLPPSMRPLVYDFGQLKKGTEDNYIKHIVGDHVRKHRGFSTEDAAIVTIISEVLAASQAYMRRREDECSFVSLRDVERAMIVFEYFYQKIDDFRQADVKQVLQPELDEGIIPEQQHPSDITSALVLAVSVCYHARLSQDQHRAEYEEIMAEKFTAPLALPGGAAQFRNEIIWCQNVLLDNMELGQNIAKNAALRENVFMMAVCIELRIPLFLVGKPGSSKSLAKSIIQDSMHGNNSRSDLLKNFKQVHIVSYQCSQLATPESVIEVFNSAKKFQSTQDTTQYVSVVVLDEVGLAEDSPNLPLKALHPLLEDGTEGAGAEGEDEIIGRDERVAFIGISNWALDPAKMNRGVMVTRGTPDISELRFSAEGICGKEESDKTKEKLEPYFKDLAEAYEAICRMQKREFFGLRDFYSLIKMIYWMCKNSKGLPLTWPQMKHAIMRNFGGLTSDEFDPYEEFRSRLNLPEEDLERENYDEKIWRIINPDCTRLGLIKTSLDTKDTSFHGENRYLLFLTENYAALDILEHYIRGKSHKVPSALEVEDASTNKSTLKPFTLFGSSFPKDKEYTQVCRNINQIKICMETGRSVILLNLENLYESLYDVLNQYYMHYGDNRYVDLGLQTHRVKCRVHENFKLILIAERETVYEKFPTPLINRLEKHFVLTSSVLKKWQLEVLYDFQEWIKAFSVVRTVDGRKVFKEGNAFIGFQKDTPAAVVFQASKILKRLQKYSFWRLKYLLQSADMSPEELATEEKGSDLWKFAVLRLSQCLLLQTAADDALIRLKKSSLCEQQNEFMELYFSEQHHKSITDFVCYYIDNDDHAGEGLLMQVTTHGHLLQRKSLEELGNALELKVEALLLQEFDTELDFCNKVGPLFQRENENDVNCLIVIQCDSGHKNGELIACARYRIYDERAKALKKQEIQRILAVTHVLFIINLPHQVSNSLFVGFQGDPWISYHIDLLCPTSEDTVDPHYAISASISELFIGKYIDDIQVLLDLVPKLQQQSIHESEDDSFEEQPSEFSSAMSSHSLEQQLHEESRENEGDEEEKNDKESVVLLERSTEDAIEQLEQEFNASSSDSELVSSQVLHGSNIDQVFHQQDNSESPVEEMKVLYIEDEYLDTCVPSLSTCDSNSEQEDSEKIKTLEIEGQDDYLDTSVTLSPGYRARHKPPNESCTKQESVAVQLPSLSSGDSSSEQEDSGSPVEEMKALDIEGQDEHLNTSVTLTHGYEARHKPPIQSDLPSTKQENELAVQLRVPSLSTCDSNSEQEEELSQVEDEERIILDQKADDFDGDQARDMSHSDVDLPKFKHLIPVNQRPIAQCRHLHTCIQAAASRINDATKDRSTQRVTRLTKLIPRDPGKVIDFNSFYGILVICLYKLLREREELRPDLSEWVLDEALNSSKLETGGTFRNVLARRIDEVVVLIFSKIIACIDINYNLDLLNPKAVNSPCYQLWLAMFREPGILQLKYSDMIQGDQQTLQGKETNDFKCKMPFSWIIKDTVDSQWDNARSMAGDRVEGHHYQLCRFIKATSMGAVLENIDDENCEEFYKFYLHDFVRRVHEFKPRTSGLDETEYQLVSDALNHLVDNSIFNHQSLISRIAALHIVHWMNKSQILCFSQLVVHTPSIMTPLLSIGVLPPKTFPEMELHLNAAVKVMELKEPPLEKDNPNPNLTLWLNDVRLHRNAIHSILNLKSSSAIGFNARHYWQRLHATQLFVEHVMLRHPTMDLKLTARRLSALWKENADFLQANTIRSVQLQLASMERRLKKECKDDKIKDVKASCRKFFMELVSTLCFGGNEPPEPDLIKNLLDTVFVEDRTTRDLTPYKNDKVDRKLTFRSTLLQLLLQHSMDQVRDHLGDYLDRSRLLLGKQATIDPDLYLLIAQCFEDSITRQFEIHCLPTKVNEVTRLLTEGHIALQNNIQGTVSLEYLEGVAKIRFSLSILADVLKKNECGHNYKELLEAGAQLCLDHSVNCIDLAAQNTTGPMVYLIKLIVRQYGMPCLKTIAETHKWTIPAELKPEEDKQVDPFVIYGDAYKQLRETIRDVAYGAHEQTDELNTTIQMLGQKQVVYFLLALYEKVTLSQTSTSEAKRISGDVLETLDMLVKSTLLSNEQKLMARALLANQQGGILEQMSASPQQPLECRTMLDLVVHTAAVFFCKREVDLLQPFISILINPAALNNSFLPTMPEDQLEATRSAMKEEDQCGNFYSCPRGHRYFVGNCGRVYSVGVCNICQLRIGGTNHKLLQGNTPASLQDTTKTGHDLGQSHTRTSAAPERGLSARAALGAIVGLVNPYVQPEELPEFFWTHLAKDLELLGQDTGKGLEESVMMIHLVLQKILTASSPDVRTVYSLETKATRQNWETIFNQYYIQPVLCTLTESLPNAIELVLNDEQQDLDQLFLLAHEKLSDGDGNLELHLWTYRTRITLEHLRQSLLDKQLTQTYPILNEFLQDEADLRATQYLPDITHLQQCLYVRFNHQIDRNVCKIQTVEDFIDKLCNDSTRIEYREMIDSLRTAWSLVGHKLKKHGPLPVEEQFYIPVIDDNTPMEFLVPTTSEAGVCTTALVHYLVSLHNSFIGRCRSLVAENDQDISLWSKHKIPITHIHRCHLVDYEPQLRSIILSHCHYSLKVGKGQNVIYNYEALEKQIVDQFIHGKPIILLDIPQVVYRKDIYTIGTFGGVRENVPQERLPLRVRQDIITELRTPVRLREALDVVEIVLGFLSSGGGKPDKPLGDYIDKTLKMKDRSFSPKAKTACQLKHALSLWETIAVELARQLCLMGQEPFDSIPPTCLRELSDDEDGEDQIAALDRCLGQFDPHTLLGTLYEFIETYVKHSPDHEHDESLVDTLEIVFDSDPTNIPASIKLNQAVATWKHIVHHYARIEKTIV